MVQTTSSPWAYIASLCRHSAHSILAIPVLILLVGIALPPSAGAQAAYPQSALAGGPGTFNLPVGVAVDGNGNVFVADAQGSLSNKGAVYEIPAGCAASGCVVQLASGFGFLNPQGIAVDRNGNVFVADTGNNEIEEILAPAYTSVTPLAGGPSSSGGFAFKGPQGVAVDGLGYVFVADTGNSAVEEIPSGCAASACVVPLGILAGGPFPFSSPQGVALDPLDNLFVADTGNGWVEKIPVNAKSPSVEKLDGGASFGTPVGVAVDPSGNVYVANSNGGPIEEIWASASYNTVTAVGGRVVGPNGVAVDREGNVYFSDNELLTVSELANSINLGSVGVGATSTTAPVTFTFVSSVTLGNYSVIIQGVPQRDFADAGSSTCLANSSFGNGDTCIVNVNFAPRAPGMRSGAVVLYDNSSPANVIGTAYLNGTGVSPVAAVYPGAQNPFTPISLPGYSSVNVSNGVALDETGNVYYSIDSVLSGTHYRWIAEVPLQPGGYGAAQTLPYSFTSPKAFATDGTGAYYIADGATGDIQRWQWLYFLDPVSKLWTVDYNDSSSIATIYNAGVGNADFESMTVDKAGNLFLADVRNQQIAMLPFTGTGTTGYGPMTQLASSVNALALTLDSGGNVYFADGSSVQKLSWGTSGYSAPAALVSTGNPIGVALDAAGSVYYLDGAGKNVVQIPWTNGVYGAPATVMSGFTSPQALAVDSSGSIYVTDPGANAVVKLDVTDPSYAPMSLNFAPTNVGGTSGDSPKTVTLGNVGNASLTLTGGAPSVGVDFDLGATSCVSGSTESSLLAGGSCGLSVSFEPLSAGAKSEPLVFTDNSLNTGSVTQTVNLTGDGTGTAAQLVFGIPPATPINATGNAGTVTVLEEDSLGNSVTAAHDSVTLTVNGTATSGYSASYTATASGGVATFNLSSYPLYAADTYTYSASASLSGVTVYSPPAYESVNLLVPTLTWSPFPSIVYGTPLSGLMNALNSVTSSCFYTATPSGGTSSPVTGTTVLAVGAYTLGVSCAPVHSLTYATTTATAPLTVVNPNFGSINAGTTSGTIAIPIDWSAAVTVGSWSVLTQGATGLDFADAGTGTCAAQAYAAGASCTVAVNFSPKAPGMRNGAVMVYDNATPANVIAGVYISGTGAAPLVAFYPGKQSTLLSGLNHPLGVAVDASGNLYISDANNNRVLKAPPGDLSCATPADCTTVGSGLKTPVALAVDGAGNVYIADSGNNRVLKETLSGSGYSQSPVLASGLSQPEGVAVDTSGNVYIADTGHNLVLMMTPSGGGYIQSATVGSGLHYPYSVAVDGSGNVYIDDTYNERVLKVPPTDLSCSSASDCATVGSGLNYPTGVAVDGSGNVYITDSGNYQVLMETLSGGVYKQTVVTNSGLNYPWDAAADNSGNVYIADNDNNRVLEIAVSQPPSLSFQSTKVGVPSYDSPAECDPV